MGSSEEAPAWQYRGGTEKVAKASNQALPITKDQGALMLLRCRSALGAKRNMQAYRQRCVVVPALMSAAIAVALAGFALAQELLPLPQLIPEGQKEPRELLPPPQPIADGQKGPL